MSSIEDLHNFLSANRRGAYTGEIAGVPTFASARDTLCVVGPPNAGKSTRAILQSIVSFPGLVVCTSTRHEDGSLYPDVVELSRQPRQQIADATGGSVIDLALDPIFDVSASTRSWSVVRGADNWRVADERASTIAYASVLDDRSIENAGFFRSQLRQMLAAMFFLCAKSGESDRNLIHRLRLTPARPSKTQGLLSYPELAETLRRHFGSTHPASLAMQNFADDSRLDPKTRTNCFAVLEAMVIPALQHALSATSNGQFVLGDLFQGTSTLYIRARSSIAKTVAPLVAALISSLVAEWRSTSRSNRPYGMLLALDEVANIAPVHSLPDIMSSGGGDGITTILGIQDVKRVEHTWPGEGRGMIEGSPLLVMPGFGDHQFLSDLSSLTPLTARSHTEVAVNPPSSDAIGRLPNRNTLRGFASEIDEIVSRSNSPQRRFQEQVAMRNIQHRLAAKGLRLGPAGSTSEEIRSQLDRLAPIKEVSTLRHSIEPHEISQMPAGTAFLRSGGVSGFTKVPGWWESPFWGSMIMP